MPQGRKRFRRRSGGMGSRKRRRTRSLRRFPRRTHKSARRSVSRRGAGRRGSSRIRTGFGINPACSFRRGRSYRPTSRARIHSVMNSGLPIRYNSQGTLTVTAIENRAGYGFLSLFSIADLLTCANYGLNIPNITNTVTVPFQPINNTSDFVMARGKVVAHMKNNTTATVRVDVWECMSKSFTPNAQGSLGTILSAGFGDLEVVAPSSPPYVGPAATDPAVSPFINPRFASYYKCQKHKTLNLLPGQTWHYSMARNSPWIVHGEKLRETNAFDYGRRTTTLVIRAMGDIGYDFTANSVGLSKAQLDVVYEEKYEYYWSPGWVSKAMILYDGLPTTTNPIFSINAVTGQDNFTIGGTGGTVSTTTNPVSTVH
jgi:hypothetical protein